jgi:hypothetical protein
MKTGWAMCHDFQYHHFQNHHDASHCGKQWIIPEIPLTSIKPEEAEYFNLCKQCEAVLKAPA